jgi:hypothetical protein
MAKQFVLSRNQMQRVITVLALNERIERIHFVEQSKSGIGPDVTVYFYDDRNVPQYEMDITDVDTW